MPTTSCNMPAGLCLHVLTPLSCLQAFQLFPHRLKLCWQKPLILTTASSNPWPSTFPSCHNYPLVTFMPASLCLHGIWLLHVVHPCLIVICTWPSSSSFCYRDLRMSLLFYHQSSQSKIDWETSSFQTMEDQRTHQFRLCFTCRLCTLPDEKPYSMHFKLILWFLQPFVSMCHSTVKTLSNMKAYELFILLCHHYSIPSFLAFHHLGCLQHRNLGY